ncbi:MAG TPA: biotin carboxylase N-terminal domain-containing protein [Actinomycetota bacterium]|nr:biotin carboxylase N-terminal domain-containing protein [Actinomycetota bacterium]
MVRRLLIANRGEIAVRVIRACRELGIEAIAACTSDDAGGAPAAMADDVVRVPSYLDAGAIVVAGVGARIDAVHPGYGFLSEDASFADAVVAAGLTWIGPPPSAMRLLGDKIEGRAIAERAGVPTVEGATGDDASLIDAARRLGPPILVKAAAGGGGRGMRAVDAPGDVGAALEAARAEAAAAFGDDRVFLERRLSDVRHVEVQILVDAHGAGIHLGERDCSLQRRHQKVVEESPSPAVDASLRSELGDAAVAVALEAGYVGAGTAEFLLLRDGTFRFLEMNARLQVEHPVTEAIAGVDLVHAQIAIARGEPLDVRQTDVELRGHAIEARVYAEDPANGFLPVGNGRVERLRLPHWPGVRIDTALRERDAVTASYDPLLAKVIAHAPDRDRALAKLVAALGAVEIVGVVTNLGFLIDALQHPDVRGAHADTSWVEEVWRPEPPSLPEGARSTADPSDPWHAFADRASSPDGVAVAGGWAQFRGWAYRIHDDDLEPVALAAPGGSLTAPMPASVLEVATAEGDQVAAGDVVVVLEAMKMQLQVRSPNDGTVTAVRVRPGDVVAAGDVLIEVREP